MAEGDEEGEKEGGASFDGETVAAVVRRLVTSTRESHTRLDHISPPLPPRPSSPPIVLPPPSPPTAPSVPFFLLPSVLDSLPIVSLMVSRRTSRSVIRASVSTNDCNPAAAPAAPTAPAAPAAAAAPATGPIPLFSSPPLLLLVLPRWHVAHWQEKPNCFRKCSRRLFVVCSAGCTPCTHTVHSEESA